MASLCSWGAYARSIALAIGRVFFVRVVRRLFETSRQAKVAGWLFGNAARLPTSASQWWVLVWLGMVASGLGLYWWNKGASLVDGGTLAVMNNALVPAGLLVNLLLWNRDADLWRLSLGGAVIASSLLLPRVGRRQLLVAKEMR